MNTSRDYRDADGENIQKLLASLDISAASGYAKFGSSTIPHLETIVLEQDGAFKGFGALWLKNLHDKGIYVSTYCNEDANFNENIAILYKKMLAIRNEKFPNLKFQTAYPSSLKRHIEFYKGNGFEEALRTYSIELPVEKLELVNLESVSTNPTIQSLQNSTLYPKNKEAILDSLIENYELNHLHNPPKQVEKTFWNDMYLGEDLLEEYSFLIAEEGNIKGVLLSRKTDRAKTVLTEVVLFSRRNENIAECVKLLLDALFRAIKTNKAFDAIAFELDDIDPVSAEVVKLLNLQNITPLSSTLITLQEK
jgi:hypothetical protein